MAVKNKAAYLLDHLRKQSQKEGISFQICLQLFFQEEFLRRLSKSSYRENLILKGGMFIYTLTDFDSRPTRDMDFLMRHLSNDLEKMDIIITEICSVQTGNDYLTIELQKTEHIKLEHKYPGVRVKLVGRIENMRVPFSVDIGIDDLIVPNPVLRNITTRLPDFEKPQIYTYSLESTIAEKFDAILQFMEMTGRMKDFFDLYYLSGKFDFDGGVLQQAIEATLSHRNHSISADLLRRFEQFADNPAMLRLWKNYEPAKNADISFQSVVQQILEFLKPLLEASIAETHFAGSWNSNEREWQSTE